MNEEFNKLFKELFLKSLSLLPPKISLSLSGGLDSSAIVYGLLELGRKPISAFTFQLGDLESQDLFFTRKICKEFDIPLQIIKVPLSNRENLISELKDIKPTLKKIRNIDMQCMWIYSKILPHLSCKNLCFGFFETILYRVNTKIILNYRNFQKNLISKDNFDEFYRLVRSQTKEDSNYNHYLISNWIQEKGFNCLNPYLNDDLYNLCIKYNFEDFHIKDGKFSQKIFLTEVFKKYFDKIGNHKNKGNLHVVGGIKDYHRKVLLEGTNFKDTIAIYNRI